MSQYDALCVYQTTFMCLLCVLAVQVLRNVVFVQPGGFETGLIPTKKRHAMVTDEEKQVQAVCV